MVAERFLACAVVATLAVGCDTESTDCREIDRVLVGEDAVYEQFDRSELEERTAGRFVGTLSFAGGESIELETEIRDRGPMERVVMDDGSSNPICVAQELLEQPATLELAIDGVSSDLAVVISQQTQNTLWPTFEGLFAPGSAVHEHGPVGHVDRGLRLLFEFQESGVASATVESIEHTGDASGNDSETAIRVGQWSGTRTP